MSDRPTVHDQALLAAEGYCDLTMWPDAWDELESLPPEERAAPAVFALRLRIYVGMKRYDSAAILAESMVAKGDTSPETWLQGSWSIRRARSVEAARAFLEQAEPHLAGDALYHYNLACYACVLGNMAETKARLAKCFNLDPRYKLTSLDDEDLAPFW